MDPMPPVPGSQPTPSPAPMTLAARLLNVFAIPGDVFDDVKAAERSAANWLVPVLLATVVGVISSIIIFSQPAIIQQIREQQARMYDDLAKSGKMTRADADKASDLAEKFSGPTVMKVTGSLGAMAASFARVFWWAFILWLLGLLFLKTRFSYLKALEVAGLATMISVLGSIVGLLLTVSFGKQSAPSLALAVGDFDAKNKFHLALAAANVFSLWLVGVMASGLARLAGAPFARTFMLVLAYWLALQFFLIFAMAGAMSLMK
jgi:hypothetical protein